MIHEAPVLYLLASSIGLGYLLNGLKLLGLVIGSITTAVATSSETKKDGRLTRAGRWVLGIGIGGALLAVAAQGVDWYSGTQSAADVEMKNHTLLVEIDRSVTRLSDISMEVGVSVDPDQPEVRSYLAELGQRLSRLSRVAEPVGKTLFGLRVAERIEGKSPFNEIIEIPAGSDALPKSTALFNLTLPTIAIYRTPINPAGSNVINPEIGGHPDLLLVPGVGALEGLLEDERNMGTGVYLSFTRKKMQVPFEASMGVESLQQLNGAQVIASYSGGFDSLNAARILQNPPNVTLFINHHTIKLEPKPVSSEFNQRVYVGTLSSLVENVEE